MDENPRRKAPVLIISLYDRVTDSTRISAVLLTGVTWFKSGGARVWLTASFSFPGRSLLDRGRREVMSFRIPVHQFINLADEPEIVLRTGRARFELSSHAMEMLRDLIRRMTQP